MDAIIDFFENAFLPTPFYNIANAVWQLVLSLIGMTSSTQPQDFSQDAWSFVVDSIYPLMTLIGATLLNIFFLVGVIRQCDNLRQNLTIEILFELFIKAVIANGLLLLGLSIIEWCFDLSSTLSELFYSQNITMAAAEHDLGMLLADFFLGIIYLVVSLICSGLLFLTVYGRYLQLYLMVTVFPVSIAALPGGQGVEQTAFAWIRTFLSKVFAIVMIALTIAIASRMCNAIDFLSSELPVLSGLDGVTQYIQNMFIMVLLAATVKGTDTFMKRAFNI